MGFSEADVIDALRVTNNKENDAVSIYTFETSIVWFIYYLKHKQTLLQFNKWKSPEEGANPKTG